jgi:hypothetical protein
MEKDQDRQGIRIPSEHWSAALPGKISGLQLATLAAGLARKLSPKKTLIRSESPYFGVFHLPNGRTSTTSNQ